MVVGSVRVWKGKGKGKVENNVLYSFHQINRDSALM